jgi:hypothetical protein
MPNPWPAPRGWSRLTVPCSVGASPGIRDRDVGNASPYVPKPSKGPNMEHRQITRTEKVIAPSEAQASLTKEAYERQRPLSHSWIRQYALAYIKGEFRPGSVMSYCVWRGKRYLVNGQHRLHAVVLAGIPYNFCVEEIVVESYEEIAEWYTTYDRLNLRTLPQAYDAYNLSEEVKLNKGQTQDLAGCLASLASGFEHVPKTQGSLRMYVSNPHIRMAFVREWRDEAGHFYEDIKGSPGVISKNLRRGPVFALALVTYRFTGADATEFWNKVALDDGLAKNDPCKKLHYFIRTTKMGEFPHETYSRYVASAWNAAWDNRTPAQLQALTATIPIRILGTPHTGDAILRYLTPQGEALHDPEVYQPENWQQSLFARTNSGSN